VAQAVGKIWVRLPTVVAYVQTHNIDGESNLKTRYAMQETLSNTARAARQRPALSAPNRNIYGFHANLELLDSCGSKQRRREAVRA